MGARTSKKIQGNFFLSKNLRKLKKGSIFPCSVFTYILLSAHQTTIESNNKKKKWLTWTPLKEKNLSLKPFWTEGFEMEKSNMKLPGKDLVLKKILGSLKPILIVLIWSRNLKKP